MRTLFVAVSVLSASVAMARPTFPVPDTGSSLGLLALVVAGLLVGRRFFTKR